MATLTPSPKMQFFDANGAPLVGGKLFTYSAGTTTPLATYTDSGAGTPNANPVILDSRGEASVWLGTSLYYMELKTSADVLVWTADNIGGVATLAALAANNGTTLINGTWFGGVVSLLSNLATSIGTSLIGFIQAGAGAVARSLQSKAREIVSVEDFGAVGDYNGVTGTDNTAAFVAAAAHCATLGRAELTAKGGNYLITGRIPCTAGTVIDLNGSFVSIGGSYVGVVFDFELGNVAEIDYTPTGIRRLAANCVTGGSPTLYSVHGIMGFHVRDVFGLGILLGHYYGHSYECSIENVFIKNPANGYALIAEIGAGWTYAPDGLKLTNCWIESLPGVSSPLAYGIYSDTTRIYLNECHLEGLGIAVTNVGGNIVASGTVIANRDGSTLALKMQGGSVSFNNKCEISSSGQASPTLIECDRAFPGNKLFIGSNSVIGMLNCSGTATIYQEINSANASTATIKDSEIDVSTGTVTVSLFVGNNGPVTVDVQGNQFNGYNGAAGAVYHKIVSGANALSGKFVDNDCIFWGDCIFGNEAIISNNAFLLISNPLVITGGTDTIYAQNRTYTYVYGGSEVLTLGAGSANLNNYIK